jgi:hypothetical protein
MKTIYKYQLGVGDFVSLFLPAGAQVLTVQTQNGVPYVWAMVDTEQPVQRRDFCWRGTGHPLGDVGPYVETIQVSDGRLVFHLFEAPAPKEAV